VGTALCLASTQGEPTGLALPLRAFGRNVGAVLHRIASATLALLIAALALTPTGEARRCLRTGAIMPPAHNCCPTRASHDEVSETAIGLPCCTVVPARSAVAQLPATQPDERLAAPTAIGVLPVIVDSDHRGRTIFASISRCRSPPSGDRLHLLSTVLRV
jgi:hypothetical protein